MKGKRKVLRVIFKLTAWTVVFGSLFFFSYWLFLFAAIGVLFYRVHAWVWAKNQGSTEAIQPNSSIGRYAGIILIIITTLGLLVLFCAGILRPTRNIGDCASGPTQSALRRAGLQAPPDPVSGYLPTSFEAQFRKRVFDYRNQIRLTLETEHLIEEATTLADQNRSDEFTAVVIDLRSKVRDARSLLQSEPGVLLNDPAKRREGEAALEQTFDTFMERAQAARTPDEERLVDDEFGAIVNQSPYVDLALQLKNILALSQNLANKGVQARVTPRIFIESDRLKGDRLVFEEAITLSAVRGELVKVDAEPLEREAALDGLDYELTLQQDTNPTPVQDARNLVISPGVRTATLISRRSVQFPERYTCTPGWRSGIRRVDLKWPSPYVVRLAVISKMPGVGLIHSGVQLDREAKLREIRVPLWSFFTAKEDLEVTPDRGMHLLRYTKGELTQVSLTDEPFWIEMFPAKLWLRNPFVYYARAYLIAENALIALLMMLAGLVLGKIGLKP